jgi:hypothetical protein
MTGNLKGMKAAADLRWNTLFVGAQNRNLTVKEMQELDEITALYAEIEQAEQVITAELERNAVG